MRVSWPAIGKHYRRVNVLKSCLDERNRQLSKMIEKEQNLKEDLQELGKNLPQPSKLNVIHLQDDYFDRSMTQQSKSFDTQHDTFITESSNVTETEETQKNLLSNGNHEGQNQQCIIESQPKITTNSTVQKYEIGTKIIQIDEEKSLKEDKRNSKEDLLPKEIKLDKYQNLNYDTPKRLQESVLLESNEELCQKNVDISRYSTPQKKKEHHSKTKMPRTNSSVSKLCQYKNVSELVNVEKQKRSISSFMRMKQKQDLMKEIMEYKKKQESKGQNLLNNSHMMKSVEDESDSDQNDLNTSNRECSFSQYSETNQSQGQCSVGSFGVLSYSRENYLLNALTRRTGHNNLIAETVMKMAMQREAEQQETRSTGSYGGMFCDSPFNLKETDPSLPSVRSVQSHGSNGFTFMNGSPLIQKEQTQTNSGQDDQQGINQNKNTEEPNPELKSPKISQAFSLLPSCQQTLPMQSFSQFHKSQSMWKSAYAKK